MYKRHKKIDSSLVITYCNVFYMYCRILQTQKSNIQIYSKVMKSFGHLYISLLCFSKVKLAALLLSWTPIAAQTVALSVIALFLPWIQSLKRLERKPVFKEYQAGSSTDQPPGLLKVWYPVKAGIQMVRVLIDSTVKKLHNWRIQLSPMHKQWQPRILRIFLKQ